MTEETKISKEIERFAQKNRIWQLARYQAQTNLNGIPDRLYLYKGYLLGIEVKTPTGKATGLQMKKLELISENGGIGVLIDDVKKFEKLINLIDASRDDRPIMRQEDWQMWVDVSWNQKT